MATPTTSPTITKRHPIRGFLYGIMFGLGLAMIAIGQKWVALGTWPPLIIFVVGVIAATAWSMFAPAKAPKGPAPSSAAEPGPAEAADEPSTDEPSTDEHLTKEPEID